MNVPLREINTVEANNIALALTEINKADEQSERTLYRADMLKFFLDDYCIDKNQITCRFFTDKNKSSLMCMVDLPDFISGSESEGVFIECVVKSRLSKVSFGDFLARAKETHPSVFLTAGNADLRDYYSSHGFSFMFETLEDWSAIGVRDRHPAYVMSHRFSEFEFIE
tara:strand:+ start:2019 stop:2522 length:504 start_codon:yes stop_codon:yes gene_type:complete